MRSNCAHIVKSNGLRSGLEAGHSDGLMYSGTRFLVVLHPRLSAFGCVCRSRVLLKYPMVFG